MKTEQELDQLTAVLPREIQPGRDLWLSLEQQLPERRHLKKRQMSPVNQVLGIAAALTLMLVVGWRALVVPDDAGMPLAVHDPETNQDMRDSETLPPQYAITQQFESLKAEQLAQLTPGSNSFGDWQYQLASWDQAIDQVSGALDYYPGDSRLLSQMQGLYQQQIDYMRLIGRVDSNEYLSGEEL